MSKRHWFPFYAADYLADTRDLSLAQHGIYLLLICSNWSSKTLANDLAKLKRIASVITAEEEEDLKFVLDRFFIVEGDQLVNPKMQEVIRKQDILRENGRKGGLKKKQNSSKTPSKTLANDLAKDVAKPLANDLALKIDLKIEPEPKKNTERGAPPLPPTTHTLSNSEFHSGGENLSTKYQPVLCIHYEERQSKIDEAEWILKGVIENLRASRGQRINYMDMTLAGFVDLNPAAEKMVYFWLGLEPAIRMAAIYFSAKKPGITNEFSYACRAVEADWDSYKQYIGQAREYMAAEDYEVTV